MSENIALPDMPEDVTSRLVRDVAKVLKEGHKAYLAGDSRDIGMWKIGRVVDKAISLHLSGAMPTEELNKALEKLVISSIRSYLQFICKAN